MKSSSGNGQASDSRREIARLVASAARSGKPDVFFGKRRWLRYTVGMPMEIRGPTGSGLPDTAVMHNVSGGGFAFVSPREIAAGTSFALRSTCGEGDSRWVTARVMHCAPGVGSFLIGAAFDQPVEADAGAQSTALAVRAKERSAATSARTESAAISLPLKAALTAALGSAIGIASGALVCPLLWPGAWLTWLPPVATVLGLIAGLGAAFVALRRDVRFLQVLGVSAARIAEGDAPQRDDGPAPCRELETLRLALDNVHERLQKRYSDERAERRRLEELNAAKTNILNMVSHDLRTPLTSILLYAEMLNQELDTLAFEDQQRFLRIICEECNRLARLVDDLLEAQRLEAGRARWDIRPHDLAPTIRNSVALFEAMARDAGIELSLVCPPRLPTVEADADKIAQVLSNLISNAIKYTSAGGRVLVSVEHRCGELCIRVADNGQGIARDHWDEIFDRFSQLGTEDESPPGVGLGLFIVRHIVERHGGCVWVDSQLGAGSEFVVVLPENQRRDEPRAAPPESNRVLLCDADPELLARITRVLRQHGYAVRSAHSGARLFAHLARGETDVVVTDLLLPDMTAEDLLRSLLNRSAGAFRVVLHTTLTDTTGVTRAALQAGRVSLLPRPADPAAILAALASTQDLEAAAR